MRKTEEKHTKEIKDYFKHDRELLLRGALLVVCDVCAVFISYFLALLLRFDFIFSHIDSAYVEGFRELILPYCLCVVVIFYAFRLYQSIWRFASVYELERMIMAWAVFQAVILVIYAVNGIRMPISFWVGGTMIGFLLTTGERFAYRFLRGVHGRFAQHLVGSSGQDRVMIKGDRDIIRSKPGIAHSMRLCGT